MILLSSHKSWFLQMFMDGYRYWMPTRPAQALIYKGRNAPTFYGTLKAAIEEEKK